MGRGWGAHTHTHSELERERGRLKRSGHSGALLILPDRNYIPRLAQLQGFGNVEQVRD